MIRPGFSLSQKALIALAVVILPILVVFLVSYQTGKKDLEAFILADLKLHADEREDDVLNFLEMHRRRAADFASDGFIRDGLEKLAKDGRTDRGRLAEYLRKNKLSLDKDLIRLILYFPDGKRAVSTDGPDAIIPVVNGAEAGSAAVVNPGLGKGGAPEIVFTAPVRSRHSGSPVGVIAAFLRLGTLDKALGNTSNGAGFKTLDIYLVDKDGFLLTKARFSEDGVLRQRIDNALIRGCVEKQREETGFYENYRGVEVAGASMCIPSLGWTVMVEVDRDEALASILDIRRYAVVTAAITLTLLAALYLFFSRFVLTELRGLTGAARRVAGGNYDIAVPVRTNDEIGILSGAFNDMAMEIKERIAERKRAEEEVRRLNAELEAKVAARTVELKEANRELEAFSYSVAHDLRAPLRIIDGFSQALEEDLKDGLDANARDHLRRVRKASARMGQLIDDLLELSRITRAELRPDAINLSAVAGAVAAELKKAEPSRRVEFVIEHNLEAKGDARLLRVAVENLIGNAWKFTEKKTEARIEFGSYGQRDGKRVYFVRDNGVGFDMKYSAKLFGAFQRLHADTEFHGTGIGLATVARIIKRHNGAVWAEGEVERGAVFYFTL